MFIIFCLKAFAYLIYSLTLSGQWGTFWNMCKCNKATRPGGKIRWIFQLSDRKTVWGWTDGGAVICLWALLCAGNVGSTCRPRRGGAGPGSPALPPLRSPSSNCTAPRIKDWGQPVRPKPGQTLAPSRSSAGFCAPTRSPLSPTYILLLRMLKKWCRTLSKLIFCAWNSGLLGTPRRWSCEHILDISGQFQKKVIIEKYIS